MVKTYKCDSVVCVPIIWLQVSVYDGNQNHSICPTLDYLDDQKCFCLIPFGLLISNLILLGQFRDLLMLSVFSFYTENVLLC